MTRDGPRFSTGPGTSCELIPAWLCLADAEPSGAELSVKRGDLFAKLVVVVAEFADALVSEGEALM